MSTDSPPNSNWRRWQTMAITRASRLSLIVVLWRTRCNKDLLYLFDIANSLGRIGEQKEVISRMGSNFYIIYTGADPGFVERGGGAHRERRRREALLGGSGKLN